MMNTRHFGCAQKSAMQMAVKVSLEHVMESGKWLENLSKYPANLLERKRKTSHALDQKIKIIQEAVCRKIENYIRIWLKASLMATRIFLWSSPRNPSK
jgi:hypothetical protein